MNAYEVEKLSAKQNYSVVKANKLVQQGRFKMSLSEQKIIAFICSMIKPLYALDVKDILDMKQGIPKQLDYEFSINNYCKICGMSYCNGKNYIDIHNTLKNLCNNPVMLPLAGGSEIAVPWFSNVTVNKNSSIVTLRLNERLAPYVINVEQNFTQYRLFHILAMRSSFSIRIYELMKSYAFQTSKVFDLYNLKHLLMLDDIPSYKDFKEFRRYVIEPAMKEINQLTDLDINFETFTEKRKVVKIKFFIKHKEVAGRMKADMYIQQKLNTKH